jgi:hypothetical protein
MATLGAIDKGCGDIQEDSVYIICPLSPYGIPVSDLIYDPVIPVDITGMSSLGVEIWPRIIDDDSAEGFHVARLFDDGPDINDVLDIVGMKDYPYKMDYFTEVRSKGWARKVSPNLDFDKLIPGYSEWLLIHQHGLPAYLAELDGISAQEWHCWATPPRVDPVHDQSYIREHHCSAHWACEIPITQAMLNASGNYVRKNKHGLNYRVFPPTIGVESWQPAIFMHFPITQIMITRTVGEELTEELAELKEKLEDRFDVTELELDGSDTYEL